MKIMISKGIETIISKKKEKPKNKKMDVLKEQLLHTITMGNQFP